MLYWIPYALVRITVFFIAGILTAWYARDLLSFPAGIAAFTALTVCYVVVLVLRRRFRRRWLNPGLPGLLAVFIAGYTRVVGTTDWLDGRHFSHRPDIGAYTVVITGYPARTERTVKYVAAVRSVLADSQWVESRGNVLLYFPGNDPKHFRYGDMLLIRGEPARVPPPLNPGEFDYQQLLESRHITHQHFVRDAGCLVIGHDPPNAFIAWSFSTRHWADSVLRRAVTGERERAIASALVLGITDHLDDELLAAYSSTGAMHVLAVSGLHIGILYLVVKWLLRPLRSRRHGQWVLTVVSIVVLWGYAAVTGLSPSVLRAVVMFTFVALAQPFHHRTNVFNTLAASAFCILLADPFLLMSVGFQLSYFAVAGIVYLHRRLYNLFEPDSRLLDEAWKITSVSIAAQVATFPLTLYYFHQFPNYFWLANFFVIPLGFAVLVTGLGILAVSIVPIAVSALGYVLTLMIRLMNYLIFLCDSLPAASWKNIYITLPQAILVFIIVIVILIFTETFGKRYLYTACVLVALLGVSFWADHHVRFNTRVLTVYHVPGRRAFSLLHRGAAYCLADSALLGDERKVAFHLEPGEHRWLAFRRLDAREAMPVRSFPGGRVIRWAASTIVQIHSRDAVPPCISADFLILSHSAPAQLDDLLGRVTPRRIIVDSSAPREVANAVVTKYIDSPIPVHSVLHHGFFTTTFQ